MTYPKQQLFDRKIDLSVITRGMNEASAIMRAYSKFDSQAVIFMMRRLNKKLYPEPKLKSHACGRTMSWAKYAGSRMNKPKHNWGKKKRARMGWKV